MIDTPECNKLSAFRNDFLKLQEFIEFLNEQKDVTIEYNGTTQNLLYRYFQIDAKKLEEERRALLEQQRKINNQ